jgi:hypothetical protein
MPATLFVMLFADLRRSKNNNFEIVAHAVQEKIQVRPFANMDLVILSIEIHLKIPSTQ